MNSGIFCSWCGTKIFESDRCCPACGGEVRTAIFVENVLDKTESKHKQEYFEPLEGVIFIAGTDMTLNFDIMTDDGSFIEGKYIWKLSGYGQPNKVIVSKNGVGENGKFLVFLNGENTRGLEGKFVQEIKIISYAGNEYLLPSGIITILPSLL